MIKRLLYAVFPAIFPVVFPAALMVMCAGVMASPEIVTLDWQSVPSGMRFKREKCTTDAGQHYNVFTALPGEDAQKTAEGTGLVEVEAELMGWLNATNPNHPKDGIGGASPSTLYYALEAGMKGEPTVLVGKARDNDGELMQATLMKDGQKLVLPKGVLIIFDNTQGQSPQKFYVEGDVWNKPEGGQGGSFFNSERDHDDRCIQAFAHYAHQQSWNLELIFKQEMDRQSSRLLSKLGLTRPLTPGS
jgi:hypothetical protein